MKKINGLLLAAMLMLVANGLMAQTYSETALLFSRLRPTGSARILGMGGAQVSLGGDFSSAFSNPAGLGMYNKSEFTITPGYTSLTNKGSYYAGNSLISDNNTDTRTAVNIPGISLVFSKPQDGEAGFIHGSFGVSMTRLNDFNSNIHYQGVNTRSSLIDYFIEQANGGTPDQFGSDGSMYNTVTELAYDNYLIGEASILNPNNPDDQYFTDFDPSVNDEVQQEENIQTKGAQNQWNISYGANFNDKFFLGAGIGIVGLNFQSHKVYSEAFTSQPMRGYTLMEDLSIKGTGLNLTVGAIVRPVDGFQLGASIATPTRYNITDTYTASMNSRWNNWDYYQDGDNNDGTPFLNNESAAIDAVVSTYNLNTPWRFSAGGSYIFGKHGLVSVDVEHLNYGGARYNSQTTGVSYKSDNDEIKSTYASTTNIRAGGEFRLNSFRFRAGFGFMPDPYKSQQNGTSLTRMQASAGVGYRASKFFIDLAYINAWGSNSYRPYTINSSSSPLLTYDQSFTNVMATLGFNF